MLVFTGKIIGGTFFNVYLLTNYSCVRRSRDDKFHRFEIRNSRGAFCELGPMGVAF